MAIHDWRTGLAAHGLGETGETVLVGDDGRLRSNARLLLKDKEAYLQTLREQGYDGDRLRKIEAHTDT